jgi:hypothetical protein
MRHISCSQKQLQHLSLRRCAPADATQHMFPAIPKCACFNSICIHLGASAVRACRWQLVGLLFQSHQCKVVCSFCCLLHKTPSHALVYSVSFVVNWHLCCTLSLQLHHIALGPSSLLLLLLLLPLLHASHQFMPAAATASPRTDSRSWLPWPTCPCCRWAPAQPSAGQRWRPSQQRTRAWPCCCRVPAHCCQMRGRRCVHWLQSRHWPHLSCQLCG